MGEMMICVDGEVVPFEEYIEGIVEDKLSECLDDEDDTREIEDLF